MRLGTYSPFLLCLASLSLPIAGNAQVSPSAVGSDRHLWVGVEFSDFQNDYVKFTRSDGIGFYGDYLITDRFGLEGEVRLLDLNNVYGSPATVDGRVVTGTLTEKTFLAGPIVKVYQYHHLTAYGKILLGAAAANYPPSTNHFTSASGSYFAFEPGGGIEYRISHSLKLRGEYDYQLWPSAPGSEISYPRPSSGLTPNGFSVGVSYRIF